jgi:phenylacetate-CoA ligase
MLRGLLLDCITRTRGEGLSHLRRLQAWQWAGAEEMRARQNEQMQAILAHAHRHVPYYREVLSSCGAVDAGGNVRLERLGEIPLLTKEIIRTRFEDLKSDDLGGRKWGYNTSGGSTGEPVRLIQDRVYDAWSEAITTLYDLWTGYRRGDRKAVLWGSERDLFVGRETLKRRLYWWLENSMRLNAFRMTAANMHQYVDALNRNRPRQILAYAAAIYELSRFIEREGIRVLPPGSILASAGTLSPAMRETIERVFRSPVFNRYGSREAANVACECEKHEGLHVSAPTHYVEILRGDGTPALPGETAEIVITLLTNYAMPLIRYRIGDLAAWADRPCSCGRAWPLLKHVAGRITDTFVSSAGTRTDGEYFTHLFYYRKWVEKFQVVQEDYEYIRVLVVPLDRKGDVKKQYAGDFQDMLEKIRLVMGSACRVEFEIVDEIPPTPSGKYRYTLSKCLTP